MGMDNAVTKNKMELLVTWCNSKRISDGLECEYEDIEKRMSNQIPNVAMNKLVVLQMFSTCS